MKNGMNVAAISELVHEIRKVPQENEIDYAVAAHWTGGLNFRAETEALRFGTKRLGRDFHFDVAHLSNPETSAAPNPADFFMLGLGSCVANIMVQGASYKGITLDRLTLTAAAEQTASQLAEMRLGLTVTSDGSAWQYKQLMMNVARFSPNYITISRPNEIEVSYEPLDMVAVDQDLYQSAMVPPAPYQMPKGVLSLGMDLSWRNATQFDATARDRVWNGAAQPLHSAICVDQPAPAAGLNEAPNPQEYLLAGITTDVLQQLLLLAVASDVSISKLSAQMSCHLDMKGCFNLFDKSAVQLQQNKLVILAASDADTERMNQLVETAKVQSACYQAFVKANKIALGRFESS